MRTVLISGSDTGIGKTHITGLLAAELKKHGERIQIVKTVESGVSAGEPGDAARAAQLAGGGVEEYTLFSYNAPLAPLTAAFKEGRVLTMEAVLRSVNALPECDWRMIESAGGIAVPIDVKGFDWADVARELSVDIVVLVVEDRLGAINQARLLASHCRLKSVLRYIVYLNCINPQSDDVRISNREGIESSGIPCLGWQGVQELAVKIRREVAPPIVEGSL